MQNFRHFRFWCQKVLPLVYDDSLSYYEVLCKIVDYINKLIDNSNDIVENMAELQQEISTIQNWIDNFDTSEVEKIIADYIGKMVFFGLTDAGYFVAYIPENWDNINFATTGYDIEVPIQPEYGHLVLLY